MQGVSGNFRPSFVENGGCWPAKPALMGKKQHPNDLKCLFWRNMWQKNALTWEQLTTAFLREVGLWRRTAKNRRDFGRPIFHLFFRLSSDIFQPISPYVPQTMLSMIFKALQIAKASLGFCSLNLVSFGEWVSWDLRFAFCTLSLCSNTQFRGTKWKKMRFPTKFARSTSSNCHGMSRDKPALGKRWGSAGRVGKRWGSAREALGRSGSAGEALGGGGPAKTHRLVLGCAEGALCGFHDVNCPFGELQWQFCIFMWNSEECRPKVPPVPVFTTSGREKGRNGKSCQNLTQTTCILFILGRSAQEMRIVLFWIHKKTTPESAKTTPQCLSQPTPQARPPPVPM